MISPFLSVLDLQVLYSNVKSALECTEETNNDYTIIVPIFGDPSYLKNYHYLKKYKDKVIIASIQNQNAKMDKFFDKLVREGFTVHMAENKGDITTSYYSIMKETVMNVDSGIYDTLRQISVIIAKTKYVCFLDGDTVAKEDIGKAIAVMEREHLDIASVRVLPSSNKTLIEKMQFIEYEIAMRARHFRPWLTSGACCIGQTKVLIEIMNTHSLYFSGGDTEIGIIAKELNKKIGYINFTVVTDVPSSFSTWFSQRVNWFGGTFRLFGINFDHHLKSPVLLIYVSGFVFILLPLKFNELSQDWTILPLMILFYIPIVFANWQVRTKYMFLFPLYGAFQSLILPFLGVLRYFQLLFKYKKIGRIKIKKIN